MSDVKWIKITTDIFDDEKILLIESLPSADSVIAIWFKLLVLAGKQNNGGVFIMNDKIPYTEEMLATIFRRDINTVRLALSTFEKFDMIEIVDGIITIPNWNKHQTLDSYEKKKERDKIYQRKRREEQRRIAEKSSDMSADCSSYVAVSDKEEDKDIYDISKDILSGNDPPPYKAIIDYLNLRTNSRYRYTTKAIQRIINGRLSEGFTFDDFKKVIDTKADQWLNDKKMSAYLRPETLFAASHFDSYLNEAREKAKAPKYPGISERLMKETMENIGDIEDCDCGDFE